MQVNVPALASPLRNLAVIFYINPHRESKRGEREFDLNIFIENGDQPSFFVKKMELSDEINGAQRLRFEVKGLVLSEYGEALKCSRSIYILKKKKKAMQLQFKVQDQFSSMFLLRLGRDFV